MSKILLVILFLHSISLVPKIQAQNSPDSSTTIIFVRHAEKLDDNTSNPHLSEDGLIRAEKLKELLHQKYPVNAIFSTGYHRTQETATPIAEALNIEIVEYGMNDPANLLQSILDDYTSQTVLIVGHSNSTIILLNTLLGHEKYEWIDEEDFTNIFVVKVSGLGSAEEEHFTY
ncbi:MAG: phosphoglycerate mutase family protein [Balneolaceae bacterium]